MGFPSNEDIKKVSKKLEAVNPVEILGEDASKVDKLKFELCREFVSYLLEKDMKQKELAEQLEIDPSRVNWIVKYRIEHFTVDRLYELLSKIRPEFNLRVS